MSSASSELRRAVVRYYERCEGDYRWLWDLDRSLAMHVGLWDERTRSLRDALARQNEVLAEEARVTRTDRVLDAGCGVGGSAIFLAATRGCRVTGVTLSGRQAAAARANAARRGVAARTEFLVGDFTELPLADASVDVVWACESVCYAATKQRFAREASRVLAPGGRLILADGFAARRAATRRDERIMRRWAEGWAVPALDTLDAFGDHLRGAGFAGLRFRDVTAAILPSTRRLFLYALSGLPFARVAELLGWRDRVQTGNVVGAYYGHLLCRRKLVRYAVVYAEKRAAEYAQRSPPGRGAVRRAATQLAS